MLSSFAVAAAVVAGLIALVALRPGLLPEISSLLAPPGATSKSSDKTTASDQTTVEVSEKGLGLLKVGTVGERDFRHEMRDVGIIDFNQDAAAAVFPPYQGKIVDVLVDLGDDVAKGQLLYTIDSPDLVAAESTLIQTAATLDLATKSLARLRQSVKNGGGAQKDLDQAAADLQTAAGGYAAARQALIIFGKTGADADRIAASRAVDPILDVRSPMTGTITLRNAAPGIFVQPGTAPAPFTVADLSRVRMFDFVTEDEAPLVRLGDKVTGRVAAFPDRLFAAKVVSIAAAADPNTHRVQIESLIDNPGHVVRPNMFAEVAIETAPPELSPAVPTEAVVRLGDGTMTVWVATQAREFTQRVVKIGLQQDGFDQILSGVSPGETVVTDGAVYVSNVANVNASP